MTLPGSPDLASVTNSTGVRWEHYQHTLTPRHPIVWRDLAACTLCLVLGLVGHAIVATRADEFGWATVPVAALWIGYWIQSLLCFMHEAAHLNLHPDKRVNDQLANTLLCPFVCQEITAYRRLHWQHHLHLGTARDTEVSYHHAPTARFLLRILTGRHARDVLANHRRLEGVRGGSATLGTYGRFALLHGSILAILVWAGAPSSAVAWGIGVGVAYPLFGALRQVLEHRSLAARARDDHDRAHDEPVNRMFGTDLLSRTFGNAGFNRHLLHHWHPATSYTRFDDMEAFLRDTALGASMDAARTGYVTVWRQLAGRDS